MGNRIINYAKQQIISEEINQQILKNDFFIEYYKSFRDGNRFQESDIDDIGKCIDKKEVDRLSSIVVKLFKKELCTLDKLHIQSELGLILFIGDGNIDGHSMILHDNVYVFIDLKAMIQRGEIGGNLRLFLCHEIVHGIHYKMNNEFYYKKQHDVEEIYLKSLIYEGIATYVSKVIFNLDESEEYWLGILKKKDVDEWIKNCLDLKKILE